MRTKFNAVVRLCFLAATFLFLAASVSQSLAGDLKLQAQLIWATNDPTSPNPKHKPVEPAVEAKLKSLPFRWTNYYEVNRKEFTVFQDGSTKVPMSDHCEIIVKNLGHSIVEVSLVGKGEHIGKMTRALPKGELLVTGGNAANTTGWFIVLKQVE